MDKGQRDQAFTWDNSWLKKVCLFYFVFFILCTYIGKLFEMHHLILFKDIYIGKFKFGEHTGRMLLLFLPLGGLLFWKKALLWKPLERYEKLAVLYLAFLLVHLLWAHYPKQALRGPEVFFYALCLYFTVKYLIQNERDFKTVLWALFFSCAVVAMVNLSKYHIFGTDTSWGWPGRHFVTSILGLNLTLTIFLFSYLDKNRVLKGLLFFFFFISYLCIIASQNRSTFFALPFGLVLIGYFYKRKIIVPVVIGFVLALILAFTIYSPTGKRMKFLFSEPAKIAHTVFHPSTPEQKGAKKKEVPDKSLDYRFKELWPAAVDIISKDPLLGIGCYSYKKETSKKYSHKYKFTLTNIDAHNAWLQMVVNLGIVGGIIYLAFLLTLIKLLIDNLKRFPLSLYTAFNLAFFAWLISHLLSEMLLYYYIKERFSLIFALAASLMIKSRELAKKESQE